MKKIGLLIPKTNLTVEYELQLLFSKGYFDIEKSVFYISKLDYKTNYKEDKSKFLEDLATDINNKKKDLKYLNVDYNAFFCTTSALENGVEEINPTISLIEESKLRNVKKCLLITPYNDKLGKEIVKMLEDNEIEVIKNINLDLLHTADYFNYGINKLEKLIKENYLNEYENIIISCTNLPTIGVIKSLEDRLNTQIISSNSSLFSKIKRDNNI
jgi:maleate cis-trans isomerase